MTDYIKDLNAILKDEEAKDELRKNKSREEWKLIWARIEDKQRRLFMNFGNYKIGKSYVK